MFEVYLHSSALDKLSKHFEREAAKGLEAMGLLLGGVYSFEGKQYAVVEEYVTGKNLSSPVSVKFDGEAFKEMLPKVAKKKLVVGWAHSHPSYGCFLSPTDMKTQETYFGEPFSVALVVDPVRGEKKFFKLDGKSYRKASHAVIRKK